MLCTPPFAASYPLYIFPQQILEEVAGHQNEAEFIEQTVEFLVEHSRRCHREEIAARAQDFTQRYNALRESLGTYVQNLEVNLIVCRGMYL